MYVKYKTKNQDRVITRFNILIITILVEDKSFFDLEVNIRDVITIMGEIINDEIIQPIAPRFICNKLATKNIIPNKNQMLGKAIARNCFVNNLPIYPYNL